MVSTQKGIDNQKLLDLVGIERARAKRSLRYFVQDAWHVLEPRDQALIWNWSIDCICDHLEAVFTGEINTLLINVPPGFMKSLLVNVFFPAWEWSQEKAHLKYMSFSYDQRLSLRDNRKCRMLIQSHWYQQRWGDHVSLTRDQATKDNYENTKGGWRKAFTIGGDYGTGERANRLIVDDPHSVKSSLSDAKREEVLTFRRRTLPSRMINPGRDSKICIMQRLHTKDYSGDELSEEFGEDNLVHVMIPMEFDPSRRCFSSVKPRNIIPITPEIEHEVELRNQKEDEKEDGLRKCKIDLNTMYAHDPRTHKGELANPERFSETEVERLRKQLGTIGASGQLDQDPIDRTGGMFDRGKVEIIPALPTNIIFVVRSWDLAGTEKTASTDPDYTACVKMGITSEGVIIIMGADQVQEDAGKVPARIRNTASQDGKDVTIGLPQDPAQAGKFQFKMLSRSLHGYRIKKVDESGKKEKRAEPFADQWEEGNVQMLRGVWNEKYLSAMESAVAGKKDLMDASSGAYYVINNRGKSSSVKSGGY